MSDLRVADAKAASEIARKYAATASLSLVWHDVVACEYDEKSDEWRVVYEASPSLLSPYFRYEVIIDAKNGGIKSAKRLER